MKRLLLLLPVLFYLGCIDRSGTPVSANTTKSNKKETISVKEQIVFTNTCVHKNLSKSFDLEVYFQRKKIIDSTEHEQCITKVFVRNKGSKNYRDSMIIYSDFILCCTFDDCNKVRSYTTGKNAKEKVVDNAFGDMVVSDFNFDTKDDIAITRDAGGNGGPIYDFYLQLADGKFSRDIYLSDTMMWFPTIIDQKDKFLTMVVHSSAYEHRVSKYKMDKNGKWYNAATDFTADYMQKKKDEETLHAKMKSK